MTIKKGTIDISNVTGDIVITASAVKSSTSTTVYDNPTITFDPTTYRVDMTQDGYSESFFVSYAPNTNAPGYVRSLEFYDNDSYKYYLTLSNQGTSKFRVDGLVPAEGWFSNTDIYGETYDLEMSTKAIKNNSYRMLFKIVDLPTELVQGSMDRINNNIKGKFIHFGITEYSTDYTIVRMSGMSDDALALNYYTAGLIHINGSEMDSYYGEYNASNIKIRRRWMDCIIHELGHCLGIKDNASHKPTLYNYARTIADDEARCNLQANDWALLESEYKSKLNINIFSNSYTGAMANAAQVCTNINEEDAMKYVSFNRPFYTEEQLNERSDIIVECQLKYVETQVINISLDPQQDIMVEYDIYSVEPDNTIKGNATNVKVKIHPNEISVDTSKKYKLYLKQYDNVPCSILNMHQSISDQK